MALARALVIRPDVLLLDEPLSNLDAKLRETVRVEIRELQRQLSITTVMVTHDQEEALIMADRLVVMSDGAVRQVGTQQELYERPADRFVAGFVGRSNLLPGTLVQPGRFETAGGIAIACAANGAPGPAVVALRPERLVLGPAAARLDNRLSGTVELVSYLGSSIDVHVRVSSGDRVVVSQPNRADGQVPKEGDTIEVGWTREAAVVFPDDGAAAGQTEKEEHR